MTHRERFIDRVAGKALQDRFQFFFQQIPDRRFCLDAAGIDVTIRLDRDLGALIPVLQKIERAGPSIAKIVAQRGPRKLILLSTPTRL